MGKNTILVAMAAQKGGVGKTFLTSVNANYAHVVKKYKILVIDRDFQKSLTKCRGRDIVKGHDESKSYPIKRLSTKNFASELVAELESKQYDIIFIDLPAGVAEEGLITIMCLMDYIFVPTGISDCKIDSFIDYLDILDTDVQPLRKIEGYPPVKIFAVLNDFDKRSKDFKQFQEAEEGFNIKFMKNKIPHSIKFEREFSTVTPYTHYNDKKLINNFCEEFIQIIKQ